LRARIEIGGRWYDSTTKSGLDEQDMAMAFWKIGLIMNDGSWSGQDYAGLFMVLMPFMSDIQMIDRIETRLNASRGCTNSALIKTGSNT